MVFLATDSTGSPFALKRLLADSEEVRILLLEFEFLVSCVVTGRGFARIKYTRGKVVSGGLKWGVSFL